MNVSKSKIHYWIKQSRHLICFLLVMIIVFCYTLNSFASTTGIRNYYHISSDITEIPYFSIEKANARYVSDGNISLDMSRFNSPAWFNQTFTQPYSDWHTGTNNTLTTAGTSYENAGPNWVFADTVSGQGYTNVDVSNSYTILVNDWQIYYVKTDGYAVIVDGYVVCDQPFTFVQWNRNNSQILYNGVRNVNSVSANGYYTMQLYYYSTSSFMTMTDMDIFISTPNSESGFSSFSDSATDFSLGDRNNYNFNYNKVDGIITPTAQGDPPPLSTSLSEHYLNASMSAKVYGHCFDDVWAGFNFSLNQYQKLHPEEFTVFVSESWTVESAATGLVTYTSDDFFDMTRFVNNGLHYYSIPLDPNDFTTYVGGVLMDLDNFFKAVYANITGLSSNYYSDSNWQTSLNYRGINATFNFQDPSTPLPTVDALLTTGAQAMTKCYIDLVIQITPSDDPDNAGSGIYHYHYNFLTGESTVVQNDMPVNVNPLEGDTSGYDIIASNGGSTVNNNTNSPVAYGGNVQITVENVAREIMQPFILEDSTVSTANVASTWNFMLHQLGDMNEENGFWQVIIKTYEMLPSEVTTMIYAAIAAILGCAVFRFYITCIRGA